MCWLHAHKLYWLSSSLSQYSVGILETCMSMISSKYLGFRAKDSAIHSSRQTHHTSLQKLVNFNTGDADLPESRIWLRQVASTLGQLPIEGSKSPNHCHTFKRMQVFKWIREQFSFTVNEVWIHESMNLHHWAKTYQKFCQASSCELAMPYRCWPPRHVAQSWEWVMSNFNKFNHRPQPEQFEQYITDLLIP